MGEGRGAMARGRGAQRLVLRVNIAKKKERATRPNPSTILINLHDVLQMEGIDI